MAEQSPSISVVLVRPQFSGNLGSVARAMKNMGLRDLRLVQPQGDRHSDEARKMAVSAVDLLETARTYPDLDGALQGFHQVVGTSRRRGKDRGNWMTAPEWREWLREQDSGQRIALLFGCEESGLSNAEIERCHHNVTIPSSEDCPSLNLAQAVLILSYEAFLASQTAPVPTERVVDPATYEKLEAMYADLENLLGESGFLDRNNPAHMMRMLRNLLNRAKFSDKEIQIFRGVFRQLRWWAGKESSQS